jgi:hypothetical protein
MEGYKHVLDPLMSRTEHLWTRKKTPTPAPHPLACNVHSPTAGGVLSDPELVPRIPAFNI